MFAGGRFWRPSRHALFHLAFRCCSHVAELRVACSLGALRCRSLVAVAGSHQYYTVGAFLAVYTTGALLVLLVYTYDELLSNAKECCFVEVSKTRSCRFQ